MVTDERVGLREVTVATVIIPAHNESAVIERCLRALEGDSRPEVIVACNGCTDDTAAIATALAPDAQVISLDVASKSAALNAGDEVATTFPRFYVDADVEVSAESLRLVAEALAEVPCAAPRPVFALSGRHLLIRHFYRVWQQMPYLNDAMVGSGVYGLSAEGRRRFDRFPDITADDQFIMQLFDRTERRSVEGATFVVHPPKTLRGLIKMRTRAYRGNQELQRSCLARSTPTGGGGAALVRLCRWPANWLGVAVYVAVNLAAKRQMRRFDGTWERDDSARTGT